MSRKPHRRPVPAQKKERPIDYAFISALVPWLKKPSMFEVLSLAHARDVHPEAIAHSFLVKCGFDLVIYDGQFYNKSCSSPFSTHVHAPLLRECLGAHIERCRTIGADGRMMAIKANDKLMRQCLLALQRIVPDVPDAPDWDGSKASDFHHLPDAGPDTIARAFMVDHRLRPVLHDGQLYDRIQGHPDGYHVHLHTSALRRRMREHIELCYAPDATGYDAPLKATPELVGLCLLAIENLAAKSASAPNWKLPCTGSKSCSPKGAGHAAAAKKPAA